MRQVPPNKFLVIGNGRTAKHIIHYLNLLNHQVIHWHYKMDSNLKNKPETLQSLFHNCDRTLLLIKDSAIDSFLNEYTFLRNTKTVHFSGGLEVSGISNVHPLISFGTELFNDDFYKNIPFAQFNSSNTNLHELLPGWPNPCFYIPKNSKSLYHGLCVTSGNLTVLLWQLVSNEFQKNFSLDNQILKPYLESVLLNLKTDWHHALTGPIVRRDEITLYKNFLSLKDTPLKNIFIAHVTLAWPEFAQKYFSILPSPNYEGKN